MSHAIAARSLLVLLVSAVIALPAQSPSIALAETFYKHRLIEDAKRTAIQVMFATGAAEPRLRCKLLLARIAADEGRTGDAMELWQDIATKHRDTEPGKAAAEVVRQWSTFEDLVYPPSPPDPRAAAWFAAARFWIGELPTNPGFDPRYFDEAEAAEHWLRKVVAELPKTAAAEQALAIIARAHLGQLPSGERAGRGALGIAHELAGARDGKRVERFEDHVAKAEQALLELKAMVPESPELPRLQFLMAHAFDVFGDAERAHLWRLRVVSEARAESLWSYFVRLRLEPVRR